LKSIRIHKCNFNRKVDAVSLLSHNGDIQINHYRTQSDEFIYGVKEQRGGGIDKHKYRAMKDKIKSYRSFNKTDTILKNKRTELIQCCIDRPQVKPRIYASSSWYRLTHT
jgi:hypothetical protein